MGVNSPGITCFGSGGSSDATTSSGKMPPCFNLQGAKLPDPLIQDQLDLSGARVKPTDPTTPPPDPSSQGAN